MSSVLFISLKIIRNSGLDHSSPPPPPPAFCWNILNPSDSIDLKGDYFNLHTFIWFFVSWLHVAVHWEMASFYYHCPMEGGGLHPAFQIVVNLLHSFIDLWISRPFLQGTHAAEGIGTVSLPSLISNNIQLYLQSLISSFILKKLVVQTEFSLEPSWTSFGRWRMKT